jgi:hypothetical protein
VWRVEDRVLEGEWKMRGFDEGEMEGYEMGRLFYGAGDEG